MDDKEFREVERAQEEVSQLEKIMQAAADKLQSLKQTKAQKVEAERMRKIRAEIEEQAAAIRKSQRDEIAGIKKELGLANPDTEMLLDLLIALARVAVQDPNASSLWRSFVSAIKEKGQKPGD